jgi:hypothetical protein
MQGANVAMSAISLISVAKWSDLSAYNNIISRLTGNTADALYSQGAGGTHLTIYNGSLAVGSGTITAGTTFIASYVWSSNLGMWLNGVADYSGSFAIPSPSSRPYQIGAFDSGYTLIGDLYAIVAVPSTVSDALRRRIEQSLAFSFRVACA